MATTEKFSQWNYFMIDREPKIHLQKASFSNEITGLKLGITAKIWALRCEKESCTRICFKGLVRNRDLALNAIKNSKNNNFQRATALAPNYVKYIAANPEEENVSLCDKEEEEVTLFDPCGHDSTEILNEILPDAPTIPSYSQAKKSLKNLLDHEINTVSPRDLLSEDKIRKCSNGKGKKAKNNKGNKNAAKNNGNSDKKGNSKKEEQEGKNKKEKEKKDEKDEKDKKDKKDEKGEREEEEEEEDELDEEEREREEKEKEKNENSDNERKMNKKGRNRKNNQPLHDKTAEVVDKNITPSPIAINSSKKKTKTRRKESPWDELKPPEKQTEGLNMLSDNEEVRKDISSSEKVESFHGDVTKPISKRGAIQKSEAELVQSESKKLNAEMTSSQFDMLIPGSFDQADSNNETSQYTNKKDESHEHDLSTVEPEMHDLHIVENSGLNDNHKLTALNNEINVLSHISYTSNNFAAQTQSSKQLLDFSFDSNNGAEFNSGRIDVIDATEEVTKYDNKNFERLCLDDLLITSDALSIDQYNSIDQGLGSNLSKKTTEPDTTPRFSISVDEDKKEKIKAERRIKQKFSKSKAKKEISTKPSKAEGDLQAETVSHPRLDNVVTNTEDFETAENLKVTETTETPENAEDTEATKTTETPETTETTETPENAEDLETAGNLEAIETPENAEDLETAENLETTENAENDENAESPVSVEIADNAEISNEAEKIQNGGICDESFALVLRETPRAIPLFTLVQPISNPQPGPQVKRKEKQRTVHDEINRGISGEAIHQNVQKPMKKKLYDHNNRKAVSMRKPMPVKKAETKTSSKISPNKSEKIDRPPISRGLSILFTRHTRSRSASQGRSSTTPKVNSRRQSISEGINVPSLSSRLPPKNPEISLKKAKLRDIPTIPRAKPDQKSKVLSSERADVSLKTTKKDSNNPESLGQKLKSKERDTTGVGSTESPTSLLTRPARVRNPGFGNILNGFLSSKSRPKRKSRDTDTTTDSHGLRRRNPKLKQSNPEGSDSKIMGKMNHEYQVPDYTVPRNSRASRETGKTEEKEEVAQAARRALAAEKEALEKEAAENYQKIRKPKREADQDNRRARKFEKDASDNARRAQRAEREATEEEVAEKEAAEDPQKTRMNEKEVYKDPRRARKPERETAEKATAEETAESARRLQRAEREADKVARRARRARKARKAERELAETARRVQKVEREAAEKEVAKKELAETSQKTHRTEREIGKDSRRAREVEREATKTARRARRVERETAEKEAAEKELADTPQKAYRTEREIDKDARRTRKAERDRAEKEPAENIAKIEAAETARRLKRAEREAKEFGRRARKADSKRSEKKVAEDSQKTRRSEREADQDNRRARKFEKDASDTARRARRAEREAVNGARRTQRAEKETAEKRVAKTEDDENELILGAYRAKGERQKWHQESEKPRPEEEQAKRTTRHDLKFKENAKQEIFEFHNGHAEKRLSHREKSERRREYIGRHKSVSQVPQTDEERRRRREAQSASHTLNEDIMLKHSDSIISADENQYSDKSHELKPSCNKPSSGQNKSPYLHFRPNLCVQDESDANSSVESNHNVHNTDELDEIDGRKNRDSRKTRKSRYYETEENRAKGRKRRETKFENEASKYSFGGLKDERRSSRRNSTYVSPRILSPRGGLLSRWRKMAGI